MYKLIKNGQVMAVKPTLLRCKLQSNGVIIIAPDGDGLIVDDTIYNLPGHEYLEVEEVADIRELLHEQSEPLEAQLLYTAMMTDTLLEEVTADA